MHLWLMRAGSLGALSDAILSICLDLLIAPFCISSDAHFHVFIPCLIWNEFYKSLKGADKPSLYLLHFIFAH